MSKPEDVDKLEAILDVELGHMGCPNSDSNPGDCKVIRAKQATNQSNKDKSL